MINQNIDENEKIYKHKCMKTTKLKKNNEKQTGT